MEAAGGSRRRKRTRITSKRIEEEAPKGSET
jgi:hypothetical protein